MRKYTQLRKDSTLKKIDTSKIKKSISKVSNVISTVGKNIVSRLKKRSLIHQHLALFGESGSGKTTLLSTFYGWLQEPSVRKKYKYSVTCQDTTEGQKLHQNYLKMEESLLPPPTRFLHKPLKFDISVRDMDGKVGTICWHDYPGEWWTETKQGKENAEKISTFRDLLQSDIAYILCDGAKFKNEGNKYIRRLFRSFREELERQLEYILEDRKSKLNQFPRLWIICLSKSDLFNDINVDWFKKEVIKSAADEIEELRVILDKYVQGETFKSIGEKYLLLSSAKFDLSSSKVIDFEQKLGIDLILPMTILLPIEEACKWITASKTGKISIRKLAQALKGITTNWLKYLPVVGNIFTLFDDTVESAIEKLKEIENNAREKGFAAEAAVASLKAQLIDSKNQDIFIK